MQVMFAAFAIAANYQEYESMSFHCHIAARPKASPQGRVAGLRVPGMEGMLRRDTRGNLLQVIVM